MKNVRAPVACTRRLGGNFRARQMLPGPSYVRTPRRSNLRNRRDERGSKVRFARVVGDPAPATSTTRASTGMTWEPEQRYSSLRTVLGASSIVHSPGLGDTQLPRPPSGRARSACWEARGPR